MTQLGDRREPHRGCVAAPALRARLLRLSIGMKPRICLISIAIAGLAGCGGAADRVSIRGDFADSAAAATVVRAVEAGREVEVKGGAFELDGLAAGPATLRLVRGADSSATLALDNAPAGTAVVLHGLRVDPASGRAFPRAVELSGTELLVINGVRLARDGALPAEVDARGSILALSDERDALLVRPDDASLPDLRVVVGLGTHAASEDGAPADLAALARGDSVRVRGRVDQGFVVADSLIVMRGTATETASRAEAAPAPREVPPPNDAVPSIAPAATVSPRALERVGPRPRSEPRGKGHGRGGGRGRGKGNRG